MFGEQVNAGNVAFDELVANGRFAGDVAGFPISAGSTRLPVTVAGFELGRKGFLTGGSALLHLREKGGLAGKFAGSQERFIDVFAGDGANGAFIGKKLNACFLARDEFFEKGDAPRARGRESQIAVDPLPADGGL